MNALELINSRKKKKYRKRILLLVFVVVIALAHVLFQQKHYDPSIILNFLHQHPIAAPLYFVLFYAVAVFFMIPTLPLNIIAGVCFGAVYGGVWSVLGSVGGAVLAFYFARSIWGQILVRRYSQKWLNWLEQELEQEAWKVVAFVRLFPGIPSGPINFIFGLTNIRFGTYAWASFAFLFPPSLVFSFIGNSAGLAFLSGGEMRSLMKLIVVTFAGLSLLTILLPRMIKMILRN